MHPKAVFIGWLIILDIDQRTKITAEFAHLVTGIASYANCNQAVFAGLLVSFAAVATVAVLVVVLRVCYVSGIVAIGGIVVIVAIVVVVRAGPA